MSDYIKREDVLNIIDTAGFWEEEDKEVACTCVNQTPAADVAPVRHGRWIWNSHHCKWECSECGGMEGECESPVCKWCGARMGKEEQS